VNRTEATELQALGDRFEQAVYGAGKLIRGVLDSRKKAYDKLRAYKAQQHGLVQNQRLLKLEYKELKTKYDALLRDYVAAQDALERIELNYSKTNDGG
jgi:hypothetical protein